MLVPNVSGNPNDGYGIETRCVCKKLPKMSVVGAVELIFYEHIPVFHSILAKNIRAERPDVLFGTLQFELYADGLSKASEVFFFRKPRREIAGLVGPNCSRIYFFEGAEI